MLINIKKVANLYNNDNKAPLRLASESKKFNTLSSMVKSVCKVFLSPTASFLKAEIHYFEICVNFLVKKCV